MQNGKEISLMQLLEKCREKENSRQMMYGKHLSRETQQNGRCVGSKIMSDREKNFLKLDVVSTLRAAAPWQVYRRKENGLRITVQPEDYRVRKYDGKCDANILFLVDASRSQGAKHRLAFAKGAVLSLIKQAYCTRDKVGMVTFGNGKCEEILPFSRDVEYAAKCLKELKASGNTPLGMGLRKALELFEQAKKGEKQNYPILVLVTDGKVNYDSESGEPFQLAIKAAEKIKAASIASIVIDTEQGYFSMGLAKKISDILDGEYVKQYNPIKNKNTT